jgi:hypothetical protein
MTRLVSRAEAWEAAYEAFENINFSAFDFETIKESLIDYMKLYYQESFNDYIESSEFIAVLELFAYIVEIYSYRLDVNAHENFITQASRKQSVLRLAKFLSYHATRNQPARGLLKIQSISTTENLFDSTGINLSNRTIIWNDPNNSNWKEQFILVMNKVLKQNFGSVLPDERIQVNDVLFELYNWENLPLRSNTFRYSVNVSGESYPMEIVSAGLNQFGPLEARPENNSSFGILYGSDGLGDGSDTTGFFLFTKQGELNKKTFDFDGITPNQTIDINVDNINEIDVWVNNVDPSTGETVDDGSKVDGKSGEWHEVDLAHSQNVIFNTNPNRNKFEIEALENDQIRIIFGDGEFADIPGGKFDVWFRTSINKNIVIPKNSVVNQSSTFTYLGQDGNIEGLTFSYSLVSSLQNGSENETIDHIRRLAPSVYYTQDRMVNAIDYNTFMLQDTSILKLRSLNRSYAGDSKYITWHEPRETYEDVKLFGDDLALYFQKSQSLNEVINKPSSSFVLTNYIEPILGSSDFFIVLTNLGVDPLNIRKTFTATEKTSLISDMDIAALNPVETIYMFYDVASDVWTHSNTNSVANDWLIKITANGQFNWTITHKTERLIAHSHETRFWNNNEANKVISFETLDSNTDDIVILKANTTSTRKTTFDKNQIIKILSQENVDPSIPNTGLVDIHRMNTITDDINDDGVPDNIRLTGIIDPSFVVKDTNGVLTVNDFVTQVSGVATIDIPFVATYQDISVMDGNPSANATITYFYKGATVGTPISTSPVDKIEVSNVDANTSLTINVKEYVYFELAVDELEGDGSFLWKPLETSNEVVDKWIDSNPSVSTEPKFKREHGRYPLNFLWLHRSPRLHLIDPMPSNIIDTYIITRSYYTELVRWLDNKTTIRPEEPTPLDLRSSYNVLLDNKMISDSVILQAGKIKVLFGSKAIPELRAKFKVIRNGNGTLTNNQVKVKISATIKEFFDINTWEFGEAFYFTELVSKIHLNLLGEIDACVLVPLGVDNLFGDLFIVNAREDEILQPDIGVDNIEIVSSYNPEVIKQLPTIS